MFEPQGSAGTRNPTFGAPGRGALEFVFHHPVLLRPSRPCLTLVGPAPSAGPLSLPASPRRLLSAGVLAVPRHLPSTPPPARRGTSSKRRLSIRPCGKTAAPLLPRSPQLVLRPARSARARRASDMSAMVGGEWGGGRRIPAHPYLASQMSDFGFRQTLVVRTLGCVRRFRLLPTYTPPPC